MNKLLSVCWIVFLSSNVMASSHIIPRVASVTVSQSDASFGQVGMITMSLNVGDCKAHLKSEAFIETVPSVNPAYTMEAIIIKVFPELSECGGTFFGRTEVLSVKTDELIEAAVSTLAPDKRALPKILRLPEVAL